MGKNDDLSGMRFGKLTVINFSHSNGDKKYWNCICDCGNEVVRNALSLIYGGSKSCGCTKRRTQDLSGMRFGKLTVINIVETEEKGIFWLCKCDCGNTKIVKSSLLKGGYTQSCGCIRNQDLTGQRFGMLEVIEFDKIKNHVGYWKCKCDCGEFTVVRGKDLIGGKTRSCGCYRKNETAKRNETHGMSKKGERLYRIWCGMKERCYLKTFKHYKNYGGRGITVCDDWRNDFMTFYNWAMANGYSDDLTLDRKDNDGNYCPENCRWITQKEQSYNKRCNILITYKGETKNILEWSKKIGISTKLLRERKYNGWNDEECIETPFGETRKSRK